MKNDIKPKPMAVLGGGSFGTVVANMLAENGHQVRLWLRSQAVVDEVNQQHTNHQYLPDFDLHPSLVASTDMHEVTHGTGLLFIAVPSHSFRDVALQLKSKLSTHVALVSLTKGIEAESFKRMSQVLNDVLPANPVAVVSGPNLAIEIAQKQLTATVCASEDSELSRTIQSVLGNTYFRVYSSTDVFGVELGGALKNIYAIMCGMAHTLECGSNTLGTLLTRSLAEMTRFAVATGANPLTFLGLAGVGDLLTTCLSPLSRNFRVGEALAQGKVLADIQHELGQVSEGVNTLRLVKEQADKQGIYMPLVTGMADIMFNGKSLDAVIAELMNAEQAQDVDCVV